MINSIGSGCGQNRFAKARKPWLLFHAENAPNHLSGGKANRVKGMSLQLHTGMRRIMVLMRQWKLNTIWTILARSGWHLSRWLVIRVMLRAVLSLESKFWIKESWAMWRSWTKRWLGFLFRNMFLHHAELGPLILHGSPKHNPSRFLILFNSKTALTQPLSQTPMHQLELGKS